MHLYQKYSGYLRKMDLQESNKSYNYDSRHLNRRETAAQMILPRMIVYLTEIGSSGQIKILQSLTTLRWDADQSISVLNNFERI